MKNIVVVLILAVLILTACSALDDGNADPEVAQLVAGFQTQTADAADAALAIAPVSGGSNEEGNKPSPTQAPEPQVYKLPDRAVWYAPNFASTDFTALFTEPGAWFTARREVDVFQFYTQNMLNDPCVICGDNLLDAFVEVDAFRKLDNWDIAIALEVGSVKEWGCTGQRGYEVADFVIQNVENAGGEVEILAMDEPRLYGETPECSYTVSEIAERTAFFMNRVHDKYPTMLIGDIEPYPHYSIDELQQWIVELESQDVELDFFHLDVDVERVRVEGQDVVADLDNLARFCEERGIPFGVILTSNWRHAGSDRAYYDSTIQWIDTVNEAIGRPQHAIFQSWKGPAPNGQHSVPINLPEDEANVYSHTRLILEGLSILGP